MAKTYGDWKIIRSLGEGGQGQTFVAVRAQQSNGDEYVLKRLKNLDRLARFEQEIAAIKRLSHPNITKVIDYDLRARRPYLVMEYCKGGALSKANLDEYPLIDRLEIFSAICSGVAHAHKNGIIHRDLKPENIFFREDKRTPVVGDFGICHIEGGYRLTLTEEAVGPRNYTSPELEDGRLEHLSAKSDVYSLGKVLYWLVSGGHVLVREKHREPRYDLTRGSTESETFIVYELLDKAVCLNPEDRIIDAVTLVEEVDTMTQRIRDGGHAVDVTAPQRCSYCGLGQYEVVLECTPSNINRHRGTNQWYSALVMNDYLLVFVCDHCGNVQIFAPGGLHDPNIWWRRRPAPA